MNDVIVKKNRNDHKNKKVVFEIRIFVFRYIQNLNKVLIDIERSKITIFDEKSQFCMFDIKIMSFVCDEIDRHSDNVKIIKIIKWENCRNVTTAKIFIRICIYYRIWVKNYVVIVEFIYRLLRKNESFVWNDEQKKTIYFLKMILILSEWLWQIRAFVLRTIDYFENADDIILTVNVSNAEWKAVLMQKHKNKKHSNRYESDLWTNVEKKYNSEKRKCRKLLKILKKIRFWLCKIYIVVKINVNIFVI